MTEENKNNDLQIEEISNNIPIFNIPVVRKSCILDVQDWCKDLPVPVTSTDLVEVRFKNTRKSYFKNVNAIPLSKGDIVAVEASPGHDIGIVTLTGPLVALQMRKNNISIQEIETEGKKVYRLARPVDIEKWQSAIEAEDNVMLQTRQIAEDLKLDMKIGDVEYQGDKTKAIFYYIADERVDFRELIKILAEKFKIRVEMRQIGARQEAGRIGGISSCGRELCCATWITNFVTVTTNSARYQELTLNPQKLAGQCGKLKCCLNYEVDCYVDAQVDFPDKTIPLLTKKGKAFLQKTDIFRNIMWYSYEQEDIVNLIPLSVEKVKEIHQMNAKGIYIDDIKEQDNSSKKEKKEKKDYVIEQDELTRFDNKTKQKRRKKPNQRINKPKLP